MLDSTTRRGDRRLTSGRLARLIRQVRARPPEPSAELPADQEWEDVSDPPEAEPESDARPRSERQAWWRRGRSGRLIEHWVPGRGRLSGDRWRGPVLLLAVLVFGVVAGLVIASRDDGREVPPRALPSASSAPDPQVRSGPVRPSASAGSIVVSVVGKVAKPGLVTLPDGARVADALKAAGGPRPDAELRTLNLARRLGDGEQIYVGVPVPPGVDPGGFGTGDGGLAGGQRKLDLNTASATDLEELPGVGPVTAQRIVEWRTDHGRFTSVEQLRDVDGIGPARFAELVDLVVVW